MATYKVYFAETGVAKTGLTPTITSRRVPDAPTDGSDAISGVTELSAGDAPGWYYFTATPTTDIVITVDGGAALTQPVDRYKQFSLSYADNLPNDEMISRIPAVVWEENAFDFHSGSMGWLLQMIGGASGKVNARLNSLVYTDQGNLSTGELDVYVDAASAAAEDKGPGKFVGSMTLNFGYSPEGELHSMVGTAS